MLDRSTRYPIFRLLLAVVPGCTHTRCASDSDPSQGPTANIPTSVAASRPEPAQLRPSPQRRNPPKADASSATSPPPRGEPPSPRPEGLTSDDTYFKHYGVNPTIDTQEYAISSFALELDTTSFHLMRTLIARGELPDEASVRVEEFINAFNYGYPAPTTADFRVDAEVVPSPTRAGYHSLRIGLRARDIADNARIPANLVFVIDVSPVTARQGALRLVHESLQGLVARLGRNDVVSIVTSGTTPQAIVTKATGDQLGLIEGAIGRIQVTPSSDVKAAMRLAYDLASKDAIPTVTNRVLLFSDGLGPPDTDAPNDLLDDATTHATRGILTSTLAIGVEDADDVLLEQLAERGRGSYAYVDRPDDARQALLQNLIGISAPVARDARIQIEFNRDQVARYRLLGYENRRLAPGTAGADPPDVGEIAAGYSATAVYELQFRGPPTADFATMVLRYRLPSSGGTMAYVEPLSPTLIRPTLDSAAPATLLALTAATFGEKLRGSYWALQTPWSQVADLYARLPVDWRQRGDIAQLGSLIDAATRLEDRSRPRRDLTWSQTEFDRIPVLR